MEEKREEFHHSRYYHRYFHGYMEEKVNGKIVRTYAEDFFAEDLPESTAVLLRILQPALSACGAALFLLSALSDPPAGRALYEEVLTALVILFMVFTMASALFYAFRPFKMTDYHYSSTRTHLQTGALACAILLAASAAGGVIFMILHGPESASLRMIVSDLVSLSCFLSMYAAARKTPYKTVKNTGALPEEGNEIW